MVQHGPANKKHLIWASLRFLLGRHLETTLSKGYYIGFSVEFTTEPFFLRWWFAHLQQCVMFAGWGSV